MSKHEKALQRLLSKPADFTWSELASLMASLGYEMNLRPEPPVASSFTPRHTQLTSSMNRIRQRF
jgi:hypothetical protein